MSGAFEKIVGGASAYWRNLERGFKILLSGEPPSAEQLLEESAEEAARTLGHGTPSELREGIESLSPEIVESGLEAMRKAVADLTTPTGALGAAAISLLVGKAGVEGKPEAFKRLLDSIRTIRDGVSVEEAIDYLSATAVEVVRELPEFRYYKRVDDGLEEAGLGPHVKQLVPAPVYWLGRAVGAGAVTGRFLALEALSFGGVIGLSEVLERLKESKVGEDASRLLQGLEVGAPVLLYILGEVAEAGDRTALALPAAAAWLAGED